MEFIALDVETANADRSSICQIGMARFENGCLAEEWSTLVNPEDYFDPVNVSIHGITEEMVRNAPVFPHLVESIRCLLNAKVAVCHTPFDRLALHQSCEKYGVPPVECTWLDSARVARRAWPQFARRGYGLNNVCAAIRYAYQAHDALEDAKAAAHVLLAAMNETGLDLAGWFKRVDQPILTIARTASTIAQTANPEGPLYGEVLVFTGALQMLRAEAAILATDMGCAVGQGVTKETTMLVVGNQDARKLNGNEKSSKHRKVEGLIRKGQPIYILTEKDFEKLVGLR
jgi:DNA polymerase-3 subunit epsilon